MISEKSEDSISRSVVSRFSDNTTLVGLDCTEETITKNLDKFDYFSEGKLDMWFSDVLTDARL